MSRKLIIITPPFFFDDEAEIITALLENGAGGIHIRKPGAAEEDMRALLNGIPSGYHPRLALHDCFQLALEENIGGVHLNSRNQRPPEHFGGTISRSCHSPEELERFSGLDYLFLSPIFDSISKDGYKGIFPVDKLGGFINEKVVALGGINENTIGRLLPLRFGGFALLGAIWGGEKDIIKKECAIERFIAIKNKVETYDNKR